MNALPTYSQIWKISYPILLSLLAQNIINVIDTAFLGRVGEVELGAAAIGGLFYVSLYMLGFGFGTGAQILMARRNGEQNYRQIGKIFDHTMYIFLVIGVMTMLISHFFATELLQLFISSPDVRHASVLYFDIRMLGILFALTNVAFRAFFVAITKTRLLGYAAAIMALVNIVLDYVLIFGHFGFPRMGIAGAAIASVIAEGVASLFFVIVWVSNRQNKIFGIFHFPRFDLLIVKQTWKISVYIMLQYFISLSAWFLFFLFVEHTGERPLAISNIIRSLYMFMMMHIWAFSSSVNTLVSNSIGAGRSDLVIPVVHRVNFLSAIVTLGIIVICLVFPEQLLRVYTDKDELISESLPVFYVVVGAILPLAIASNWFNGVSGTAHTRMALLIESVAIIIYLIYVYFMTFIFTMPLPYIWSSEFIYIFSIGIFSYFYLRSEKWKSFKV